MSVFSNPLKKMKSTKHPLNQETIKQSKDNDPELNLGIHKTDAQINSGTTSNEARSIQTSTETPTIISFGKKRLGEEVLDGYPTDVQRAIRTSKAKRDAVIKPLLRSKVKAKNAAFNQNYFCRQIKTPAINENPKIPIDDKNCSTEAIPLTMQTS